MTDYSRPYCKNCKLIWGKYSIGFVLKCTKCGRQLTLRSFNPWAKTITGAVIIIISLLTFLIPDVPIVWIGGFIVGGSVIYNGLNQWSEIEELDKKGKNF
jgi:hypothetical protein